MYVLDLYDVLTDNLQSFLALDDVRLGDSSVPIARAARNNAFPLILIVVV